MQKTHVLAIKTSSYAILSRYSMLLAVLYFCIKMQIFNGLAGFSCIYVQSDQLLNPIFSSEMYCRSHG